MNRAGLILIALATFCLPTLLGSKAWAHLNHVQFATVEESEGKLLVRYRMSADMFMTNLELLIKSGVMPEDMKRLPLDKMVAKYFEKHLTFSGRSAESVSFKFDDKNGDWVTDFRFSFFGEPPTLFCDAFFENNPNTQTLARIKFRNEQTVFHFRKGNSQFVLGSSENRISGSTGDAPVLPQEHFLNGLAVGFHSYVVLLIAVLLLLIARKKVHPYQVILPILVLIDVTMFAEERLAVNIFNEFGQLAAISVFALTVQKLIADQIPFFNRGHS